MNLKTAIVDLEALLMSKKIIKHNDITHEAKHTLLMRTLIALLMLVVFLPCLFLGGYFYLALVIFAIGAATYEVAKASQRKFSYFIWIVTFIVIYALIFWVIIKTYTPLNWNNFDINLAFSQLWLSPIALGVMIGVYFFVAIIKEDFLISDACYLIAMCLLLSLTFQAVLYIRYIPFSLFKDEIDISSSYFKYAQSTYLIIYLLIAIFFNDIGAYLTGMFFGKHKMNPRISPKKTWEGFVGGILVSFICSLTFGLLVGYFNSPMLPSLDFSHWYWILLISIILPFVGNLGDFTFSAIKRNFAIKDYSHVLGPHGGILDRIDSTLFGALALAILIIFILNG